MRMNKIVFHIDELAHWEHTLANIHNLSTYATEQKLEIQIKVLVNGDAIMGYLMPSYIDEIGSLSNVNFRACNNSLKSHAINPDQLPKSVTVVPVGVYDLLQLQDQGYRYVKP